MNKENTQALFTDFPTLFYPDKSERYSLMCFGFECGDGWFNLLYRMCAQIQKTSPPDSFEIIQVKQKFGGLRVYCNGESTPEIVKLIDEAEEEAERTCEDCSAPSTGPQSHNGWIVTLCDRCRTKYV